MSFVGFAKERFMYYNTLLCLVRATEDKNITIDLRNDSYVCGTVLAVDGFMNVTLTNAVYCDPQGNEYQFESIFVQARNIRYIHIPESMPIVSTINQELTRHRKKPQLNEESKNVLKSRKRTKALLQHMKTVESLK